MLDTTIWVLPLGTLIVKFPSKSATLPTDVPFTMTVAPISGSPWVASSTVPRSVVCAMSVMLDMSAKNSNAIFLIVFCLRYLFFVYLLSVSFLLPAVSSFDNRFLWEVIPIFFFLSLVFFLIAMELTPYINSHN